MDWIAPPSSQNAIKRVKSALVEIFCLPHSITLRYSQIFNSCLSYISCIQGKCQGLLVVSCLLHLNSRILKPLLHVVTCSWNLGATALHRFRRCCTVLHGMFHETFFLSPVARQVSRKVELLSTSATVVTIAVVIKQEVSGDKTRGFGWNWSHSALFRYAS